MTEAATKLPAKEEKKAVAPRAERMPEMLETLRREIDRVFDGFPKIAWGSLFRHPAFNLEAMGPTGWGSAAAPAVDIVEKDGGYEVTAELPGIDEKDIDVKVSGGVLTIKGEKEERMEEKKKDYHLSERRFGSFQRSFALPEGIDADRIDANFRKGVLTVTLPKSPEAKKREKKIAVGAK